MKWGFRRETRYRKCNTFLFLCEVSYHESRHGSSSYVGWLHCKITVSRRTFPAIWHMLSGWLLHNSAPFLSYEIIFRYINTFRNYTKLVLQGTWIISVTLINKLRFPIHCFFKTNCGQFGTLRLPFCILRSSLFHALHLKSGSRCETSSF
jgi:hypothetical protein